MKKKIALLLAAAMTVSMLPMSAMAGSTNTISVTANVKTNEAVKVNGAFTQLQIKPLDTIASNSSIVLDLENGEYNEDYFKECVIRFTIVSLVCTFFEVIFVVFTVFEVENDR